MAVMDLRARRGLIAKQTPTGPILKVHSITRTATRTQATIIQAPHISGYEFLVWLGISCDDFTGFAYVARAMEPTGTYFYNRLPPNSTDYHITISALYVRKDCQDLVEIREKRAAATQGVTITADNVDGMKFLAWVNITASGYYGAAYINHGLLNPTRSWDVSGGGSSTGRYAYALYLKEDSDLVYGELYSTAAQNLESVVFQAEAVHGYDFLCWCSPASNLFIARMSIRNRDCEQCEVTIDPQTDTSNAEIRIIALYLKGADV